MEGSSPTVRLCAQCGAPLPADAPKGVCPRCELQAALGLLGEAEPTQSAGAPEGDAVGVAGRQFGNYELVGEIARGGMGVVYKARQRGLDRIVAVKMILVERFAGKQSVQRFRGEAAAAGVLQHPNIVAIHEVGEHEGQPFFSMDYVEGQTLADLVRDQLLSAQRAARYLKTVAEAIHFAHQRGILHRDLKPSNVLIDQSDEPRVTDFGLAKRLGIDSDLTVSGQVLGSPNFMSPEQAEGRQKDVGPTSDVYALGGLLYHLLTRQPPFQGDTLTTLLKQVVEAEPVPPRRLNPSVPRDLETICLKCLEKDVARRYPTAQALADELGRFLEGEPIQARPVSAFGKAWKWCQRRPALAGTLAALFLTFLFGFTGVLWQWRRATTGELQARRIAYVADMNNVQAALANGDLGRVRALLDAQRPGAGRTDLRGWEWRYFWQQCRSDEQSTLLTFSNTVTALAFAPDGQRFVARLENGPVVLWDGRLGRPVVELPGAGREKIALALSPSGNLLAWSPKTGNGLQVELWDIKAGKSLASLPHDSVPISATWSPDERWLATLATDGTARLWDVQTRSVARRITTPAQGYSHYGCVTFSPDGRKLAIGECEGQIRLVDIATGGEFILPLSAPDSGITALAFSPDGRLLASACGYFDKDIHLWDLESGAEKPRLTGHRSWIADLSFSPDGGTLASASGDQTLRLWDVQGKSPPTVLRGNTYEVWSVVWSSDGRQLLSGGRDGAVRRWDPRATPSVGAYEVLPSRIGMFGLGFSPDGQTLLAISRTAGAVTRWDLATARTLGELAFAGTNHLSLAVSPEGRRLATCDGEGHVRVWDLATEDQIRELSIASTWLARLEFSRRGRLLVAFLVQPGDSARTVQVWDTTTWHEVGPEPGQFRALTWVSLAPDDRTLAIGQGDGTIAQWDCEGRHCTEGVADTSNGTPDHLAHSPDGRWFVAGSTDGRIALWNLVSRQLRQIDRSRQNAVHAVGFSPDGERLVTGGGSTEAVTIWDPKSGRDVATLPGEPGLYYTVQFSPDGNTLGAVTATGTALLWRAPSWADIDESERKGHP